VAAQQAIYYRGLLSSILWYQVWGSHRDALRYAHQRLQL